MLCRLNFACEINICENNIWKKKKKSVNQLVNFCFIDEIVKTHTDTWIHLTLSTSKCLFLILFWKVAFSTLKVAFCRGMKPFKGFLNIYQFKKDPSCPLHIIGSICLIHYGLDRKELRIFTANRNLYKQNQ